MTRGEDKKRIYFCNTIFVADSSNAYLTFRSWEIFSILTFPEKNQLFNQWLLHKLNSRSRATKKESNQNIEQAEQQTLWNLFSAMFELIPQPR